MLHKKLEAPNLAGHVLLASICVTDRVSWGIKYASVMLYSDRWHLIALPMFFTQVHATKYTNN